MRIQQLAMSLMLVMVVTGVIYTRAADAGVIYTRAADAGVVLAHEPVPGSVSGQRNMVDLSYVRRVGRIVAYKLHQVRAAEEQSAMRQTGRPVRLPTGKCRAVIRVASDGIIRYARIVACASRGLAKAELEAIRRSSPLPDPPRSGKVRIDTIAPVAVPRVRGATM